MCISFGTKKHGLMIIIIINYSKRKRKVKNNEKNFVYIIKAFLFWGHRKLLLIVFWDFCNFSFFHFQCIFFLLKHGMNIYIGKIFIGNILHIFIITIAIIVISFLVCIMKKTLSNFFLNCDRCKRQPGPLFYYLLLLIIYKGRKPGVLSFIFPFSSQINGKSLQYLILQIRFMVG